MTAFWVMKESLENFKHRERSVNQSLSFGTINGSELGKAERAFKAMLPGDGPFTQALPDDFPTPLVCFSDDSFLPDYLGARLVSRRLRDAMALPFETAQFLPCRIAEGSVEATWEMSYFYMYLRAVQPAMDLERSKSKKEACISNKTGAPYLSIDHITQLVLRADLEPQHGLFRMMEHPTTALATDALAERVQRAGCSGVVFLEPGTAYLPWDAPAEKRRYRTLDGVVAGLE